ncbi:CopG family transcriptional regulator [Mycobacterium sp. 1274756.6]|uniref:type II toxin-antitoxin system BrnA family antitoxin n=1 Tax=Mycobacterium sp. 1274756.6 TaxID=1834076 RepID=UPI0008014DAB|nr:CopG family transcriptional regulator [Mycobacterium sp. 1274756.6]OBJ72991.1 CopG family transcriptional regulator [Mycobacterium sp. 1274756.6]
MKASDFAERFDAGQDVSARLDTARARRPGEEPRRVNVDFPAWMIAELDREATRLGVTRQSLIKVWIAEKLDRGDPPAA